MAWQCRLVDNPFGKGEGPVDLTGIRVGDMWFDPYKVSDECPDWMRSDLSDEYRRDWLGKRAPIVVAVPGTNHKHGYRLIPIDEHYQCGPGAVETHGWTVTGVAPNITCQPSINAVGDWHGWLRDGVLSDDVGGRTYPHREG